MNKKLSRRDFLKLAGVTSAGLALSACGVNATELPTATFLPPTGTPLPTETLTPTLTSTPIPVEQLPETKQALAEFAQAFKAIEVNIQSDQLIQKGLETRTMTGKNGNQYDIALAHVENVQLGGDYPLMIREKSGKWNAIDFVHSNIDYIGTSVVWNLLDENSKENISPEIRKKYKNFLKKTNAFTIKMNWYDYQPKAPDDDIKSYLGKNMGLRWALNQIDTLGLDNIQTVRAQELLYHVTAPQWIRNNNITKEEMKKYMEEYLTQVMKHFSGQVKEWIVVNEPYGDKGMWAPYRDDPFFQKMGEEYIIEAFRIARKADPNATLIYNDIGNHTNTGAGSETTANTLERVSLLKKEGLIDMVGIQMHMFDHSIPNKEEIVKTFLAYDIPVAITELDVDMSKFQGTDKDKAIRQAEIYQIIFEACIESGVCKEITFWEPGDKFNWRETESNNKADATLFDEGFDPKPAYFSTILALYH